MSPNRLLASALLVAVATTGCAAGMRDETSKERTTPYVANANVGNVQIRDALISPAAGSGSGGSGGGAQAYLTMVLLGSQPDTLTGASIAGGGTITPQGGPIKVVPNQLVAVTDPELQSGSASPAASASPSAGSSAAGSSPAGSSSAGSSTAPSSSTGASPSASGPLPFGGSGESTSPGAGSVTPSGGSSALVITGLSQPPQIGTAMQVTLTFQTAGTVTLQVPVDVANGTDR